MGDMALVAKDCTFQDYSCWSTSAMIHVALHSQSALIGPVSSISAMLFSVNLGSNRRPLSACCMPDNRRAHLSLGRQMFPLWPCCTSVSQPVCWFLKRQQPV